MILRSSNQLPLGVRWVSRLALAFAVFACGGSSEDSSIGTRGGALVEDDQATSADAASTDAPDLVGTSNDPAAATGSCVPDDDSDSDDLDDSDDSDDSDSDDDDGVDDDADEVDDDDGDVDSAADVDKSAADDDSDDDADDSDDSDGDDADDDDDSDGDDDDSDGDDCVPAPEAPAADPSAIK